MNNRVIAFKRFVIFAQVSAAGSPMSARNCASVRMTWDVRG